MYYDTEFPMPTRREGEALKEYFETETQFMATQNFYIGNTVNQQIRRHAVSIIARLSQGEDPDAFIPYLAMNFFDRFISRKPLNDVEGAGRDFVERVSSVAISCFTLSAKIRTKQFTLLNFLRDKFLDIRPERIIRIEFQILETLNWRMHSVTPFSYLDYYYPGFTRIGGFKRRCINEIIVQSQGEYHFTAYKPSQIALSALLAASEIGYPSKFGSIDIAKSDEVSSCCHTMVHLCERRKIEIRSHLGMLLPPSGMVGGLKIEEIDEKHEDLLISRRRSRSKPVPIPWKTPDGAAAAAKANQERQDKDVDIHEEDAAAETNAEQGTQDKDVAVLVEASGEDEVTESQANKSEIEEDVEAETELNQQKQDKGEVSEVVAPEINEASLQVQDSGMSVGVAEITDVDEEAVPQRPGKEKAVEIAATSENVPASISEIVPADAAPKKLMNFDLRWPISVQPDELTTHTDNELITHTDDTHKRRFSICACNIS